MPVPSVTNLKVLKQSLNPSAKHLEQIILSDHKSYTLVDLKEILFLEAQGNYVTFYLEEGVKKTASQPLNYYEELLPNHRFFRIHKSYLISLDKVKEFSTGRGGEVSLGADIKLPIAFRRKPDFIRSMQGRL